MTVDISKLNEGEAEVLNNALDKILSNIENSLSNDIRFRNNRTLIDRLDEYDLWNPNGIIEEYSLIKNKESQLPSTLRKAICTIFEASLVSLLKYKQNEVQ